MVASRLVFAVLACFTSVINAATFTPLLPPSYPLAVKNPYLSAWLPGNQAANLHSCTPQFWNGNALHWAVLARVGSTTYNLFGVPSPLSGTQSGTLVSAYYTSSHTTFVVTAGAATITLDFVSNVAPLNYIRQSMPYSYLTVTANASGVPIEIYSDIDDTWTGQSSTATTLNYTTVAAASMYQLSPNGATYAQNGNEQALWGTYVYATTGTYTSQSGTSATVRGQFVNSGSLSGAQPAYAPGNVVGFAHDLGTVTGSAYVVFAMGHVREKAINWLGSPQTQYFRSSYPDIPSGVNAFFADYSDALVHAAAFDNFIQEVGVSSYGTNYSDIMALSVRQVMGGIELTVPADTRSTSGELAFLKEISSDGNVNTVDVLFPTFPFFYLVGPDIIRLLLLPEMQFEVAGKYNQVYPAHDLGANYPNATGPNVPNEEKMPVEESGNLLIMFLAYQQASGSNALTTQYSSLLKGWADYLVANGEYPTSQLSVNDGLGAIANQTNLGIKAAVGLAAYGTLTGQSNYTAVGVQFATKLYSGGLGLDPTGQFFTLAYGDSTFFMVFNMYPDILLGLNAFPAAAYNLMSAFYPTVRTPFGILIEGAVNWGQTNWQSWVAPIVSKSTQGMFIADMHSYISNGMNSVPFCDRYYVTGAQAGQCTGFRARPAVGSHFALAAVGNPNAYSAYLTNNNVPA